MLSCRTDFEMGWVGSGWVKIFKPLHLCAGHCFGQIWLSVTSCHGDTDGSFYSSFATSLTQRKRSIWNQCKKYEYWRPTDDRPKGQFAHVAKNSNAHNSATRQPIHFTFGSIGWGFRGRRIERGHFRLEMAAGGHLGKL